MTQSTMREREREIDHLPVNSHAIFSIILNGDKYCVTFLNTKEWPRELTIYSQHALGAAQPGKICLLQLQPEMDIDMRNTNVQI